MQYFRPRTAPSSPSLLPRVALVAGVILAAWFITRFVMLRLTPKPPAETIVHALVVDRWGDCTENDCDTLTITTHRTEDGGWTVEAVHDGLADDSVRAMRFVAELSRNEDGTWVIGEELTRDWRCQVGRGHEEFLTELCV